LGDRVAFSGCLPIVGLDDRDCALSGGSKPNLAERTLQIGAPGLGRLLRDELVEIFGQAVFQNARLQPGNDKELLLRRPGCGVVVA
jgi:hypothetical protein